MFYDQRNPISVRFPGALGFGSVRAALLPPGKSHWTDCSEYSTTVRDSKKLVLSLGKDEVMDTNSRTSITQNGLYSAMLFLFVLIVGRVKEKILVGCPEAWGPAKV